MWIGSLRCELLLGEVHSLKAKRSLIRPLVSEIRRHYAVSVAEVDQQDKHRRAVVGVVLVAGDRSHAVDVLDAVERFVAGRPELELLDVHRRYFQDDD